MDLRSRKLSDVHSVMQRNNTSFEVIDKADNMRVDFVARDSVAVWRSSLHF